MKKDTTANSFFDNYKDPRWQKKRLEIMKRDGFKCLECGSTTKTLNVHHIYYEKGKMPWEYSNNMLATLCEDCHKKRHDMQTKILFSISQLSRPGIFGLYRFLYLSSPHKFLEKVNKHKGYIDFDSLAEIIPILSGMYEMGAEDNS